MENDTPVANQEKSEASEPRFAEVKPFPWAEILSGSTIVVTKQPAEPPKEKKEFDLAAKITDSFAIMASAATIICLTSQVKK